MSLMKEQVPDPEVPSSARTLRYSASYKSKILAEHEELDNAGNGALLRREGLYSSLISRGETSGTRARRRRWPSRRAFARGGADSIGWQYIFWLNVPSACQSCACSTHLSLPSPGREPRRPRRGSGRGPGGVASVRGSGQG